MRRSAAAAPAALLLLLGAGCAYGPPVWEHRLQNAMSEPGGHRFAVSVVSTQRRWPANFLAKFPDGGAPRTLRETARLWLLDDDARAAHLLSLIERPARVRSEYSAWIAGWDRAGERRSVYLEVSGREGETSDTRRLRWLLKVEVGPDTAMASAVTFLPADAVRPAGPGPLPPGRGLQVALGDTISVRTDASPEFRPRFRLNRETGAIEPLSQADPTPHAPNPSKGGNP